MSEVTERYELRGGPRGQLEPRDHPGSLRLGFVSRGEKFPTTPRTTVPGHRRDIRAVSVHMTPIFLRFQAS